MAYIVQIREDCVWFDVGSYASRSAADHHVMMVRDAKRRAGRSWRGQVRVIRA